MWQRETIYLEEDTMSRALSFKRGALLPEAEGQEGSLVRDEYKYVVFIPDIYTWATFHALVIEVSE